MKYQLKSLTSLVQASKLVTFLLWLNIRQNFFFYLFFVRIILNRHLYLVNMCKYTTNNATNSVNNSEVKRRQGSSLDDSSNDSYDVMNVTSLDNAFEFIEYERVNKLRRTLKRLFKSNTTKESVTITISTSFLLRKTIWKIRITIQFCGCSQGAFGRPPLSCWL